MISWSALIHCLTEAFRITAPSEHQLQDQLRSNDFAAHPISSLGQTLPTPNYREMAKFMFGDLNPRPRIPEALPSSCKFPRQERALASVKFTFSGRMRLRPCEARLGNQEAPGPKDHGRHGPPTRTHFHATPCHSPLNALNWTVESNFNACQLACLNDLSSP